MDLDVAPKARWRASREEWIVHPESADEQEVAGSRELHDGSDTEEQHSSCAQRDAGKKPKTIPPPAFRARHFEEDRHFEEKGAAAAMQTIGARTHTQGEDGDVSPQAGGTGTPENISREKGTYVRKSSARTPARHAERSALNNLLGLEPETPLSLTSVSASESETDLTENSASDTPGSASRASAHRQEDHAFTAARTAVHGAAGGSRKKQYVWDQFRPQLGAATRGGGYGISEERLSEGRESASATSGSTQVSPHPHRDSPREYYGGAALYPARGSGHRHTVNDSIGSPHDVHSAAHGSPAGSSRRSSDSATSTPKAERGDRYGRRVKEMLLERVGTSSVGMLRQGVQFMQVGGVALLFVCVCAVELATGAAWGGEVLSSWRCVDALWSMCSVCVGLSLLCLWWGLAALDECRRTWRKATHFAAHTKDGRSQSRKRSSSSPLQQLQQYLNEYRRAETQTKEVGDMHGPPIFASLSIFASLNVIAFAGGGISPFWACAVLVGDILVARAVWGMSRLSEAMQDQRESMLYLHAQGTKLAAEFASPEHYTLYRSRLELVHTYVNCNRKGFVLLGVLPVPQPNVLSSSAFFAAVLICASMTVKRPQQSNTSVPCPACECKCLAHYDGYLRSAGTCAQQQAEPNPQHPRGGEGVGGTQGSDRHYSHQHGGDTQQQRIPHDKSRSQYGSDNTHLDTDHYQYTLQERRSNDVDHAYRQQQQRQQQRWEEHLEQERRARAAERFMNERDSDGPATHVR